MRTDVKVGVLCSFVLVVTAGWYYLRAEPEGKAVPLAKATQDSDAQTIRRSTPNAVTPPVEKDVEADRASDVPVLGAQTPDQDAADDASTVSGGVGLGSLLSFGEDDANGQMPSDDAHAGDSQDVDAALTSSVVLQEPASTKPNALAIPATTPETAVDPLARAASKKPEAKSQAPAPSSEELEPLRPGTSTHTVERGDTFSVIADIYYGSERFTDLLIKANPAISNPNRLAVGTVVRIPSPDAMKSASSVAKPKKPSKANPDKPGTYRVQEGDTFYAIAADQLGSASRWHELLELNSALVKGDPKKLRPGQLLQLPPKKAKKSD